MMTNCFYCGKHILTECDEHVISPGTNKNGDMDYLVYCVNCTETVKKLKEEKDIQVKLTTTGLLKRIKLKRENEELLKELTIKNVTIHEMNKLLKDQRQQIEKMKCCDNCKKINSRICFENTNNKCDKWELKQ